jgi:signal peptidase I
MLARWFLSRRFRHAVEVRKHLWKIRNFQRDELSPAALAGIDQGILNFDAVLRSSPSKDDLSEALTAVESSAQKWLRPYANASLRENVEVFLVAIGVAMAIRTFFLQPFKIPTGSMQPTLYGVHFEDLRGQPGANSPNLLGRIYSAVIRGEFFHELVAEADGAVLEIQPHRMLALINYQDVTLRYQDASGRSYDKTHRFWFSPVDGHGGDLRGLRGIVGWDSPELFRPLVPGQPFRRGDVLMRLKDSAGDHLFVDRLTFNFRPPRRGEIIVFETAGIRDLPPDQFYIKRLVALENERVRILDDRHLVINGTRLDASTPHFQRVYSFTGPPAESDYSGHVNGTIGRRLGKPPSMTLYFPNERAEVTVAPKHYMVMGDNTLNSYDSRGWGDFPQTNVVGKYCFVWWPFTGRWGTRPD